MTVISKGRKEKRTSMSRGAYKQGKTIGFPGVQEKGENQGRKNSQKTEEYEKKGERGGTRGPASPRNIHNKTKEKK